MKKLSLRLAIVLVALLIAGVVVLALTFDRTIRHAVVTVGPKITGVKVELDAVDLSLRNGEGRLKGFLLGNPAGYTSPGCVQFDRASLALDPVSLLSDKIVVRHVRLQEPVITFEASLRGNNFNDLRKGMAMGTEASQDEQPPAGEGPVEESTRKLQVDEFTLTGARLNVLIRELGSESKALVLPDIQLTDLGTGPEGITSRELTQLALDKIFKVALEALAESGGDTDQLAEAALRQLNQSGNSDLEKAARGVFDYLKKKE
jgi:uncharacterized protein involved in outer membrane biogenesis